MKKYQIVRKDIYIKLNASYCDYIGEIECSIIRVYNYFDVQQKYHINGSIKNGNAVMRYYESEKARLQRTGVAVIDENDKIVEMEEKPKEPKSNWAIPPFYIFKKDSIIEIKNGIESGCKTDAPGGFIEWLCKRNDVYAYEMPGKRIDIGNLEDYYKIK